MKLRREHRWPAVGFALILAAILWQLSGPMLDLVRLCWWKIERM